MTVLTFASPRNNVILTINLRSFWDVTPVQFGR